MTALLLDTTLLIALSEIGEATPDLGPDPVASVSALSWGELLRGTHSSRDLGGYKSRSLRYERLRDYFGPGIPFDDACVHAYDRVLRQLAELGRDVHAHRIDPMIAATALAYELPVVTRDRSGFAGLDGLIDVIER